MPPLDTGQKQRIVIIDGTGAKVGEVADLFDVSGKRLVFIDAAHEEIHEGESYSVCKLFTGIADDAAVELLLIVSATKNIHMTSEIEAEGKGVFEIFEAPDVSANGTPIVPRNLFRDVESNPDQSTALAFFSPTIDSDDGLMLREQFIPGGVGPQSSGVSGGARFEWILAKGIKYLFRFTNTAGVAKDMSFHVSWYESNAGG